MLEFFTSNLWVIAMSIAAFTTLVTEAIGRYFTIKGVWNQVVSWVVAIALTVATYFVGTFDFVINPWISVPAVGLAVGLVSNGLYDVPTLKGWIKTIVGFFFPNKEV